MAQPPDRFTLKVRKCYQQRHFSILEKPVSGIPVGISTCLLGKEVRHDGGHKHSRYCTQVLSKHFEFRSICPELEAGLGVPRPAIHLREHGDGLHLVESKGRSEEHTSELQSRPHLVCRLLLEKKKKKKKRKN